MSQEFYDPLERNEGAQAEKQESAARIVSVLRLFDFGMLSPVPPEIQGVTVRVAWSQPLPRTQERKPSLALIRSALNKQGQKSALGKGVKRTLVSE